MKTIWKYALGSGGQQTIRMPAGSRVVHVRETPDGTWLNLWAEVDTTEETEERTFSVFGTGHQIPENQTHVGTAILFEGRIVLHVYEPTLERGSTP